MLDFIGGADADRTRDLLSKTHTRGRNAPYLPTTFSHRRSPKTQRFLVQELRTNGKHARPAPTARMRKFLVILNAMLHNKTRWQTPAATFLTSSLSSPWAWFLNTVPARWLGPKLIEPTPEWARSYNRLRTVLPARKPVCVVGPTYFDRFSFHIWQARS